MSQTGKASQEAQKELAGRQFYKDMLLCGINALGVTLDAMNTASVERELKRRKVVDVFYADDKHARLLDSVIIDPALPCQEIHVKTSTLSDIMLRIHS